MNMPPLYLVFALTLFNLTNNQASRMLLTLYALKLDATPFAVGAIAATFSAFPMLLAWLAGKLSDRFHPRWLLMFGAAGSVCGMLVPYAVPQLPALYVAAAMNGLSFTFYAVSLQNLVGILGTPQERARNFSNFAMVAAVASFIGPLISGFSIDHLGFGFACLIVVLLSLVPVFALAFWGGILPGRVHQSGPAGNVRGMLSDPGVRRVLASSGLVVLGIDLFQFYLPIYGHAIALSASAIGIILAMFSAAAFVVRIILPRLVARFHEEAVLAYAFSFAAACFILIPFFSNAYALSLVSFIFGLGMGCGPPITMMLTYSQSPQGRSGEALGLRLTANYVARVAGPLVFGSIGSAFGLLPVFWGNALMMAAGGMLSKRSSRDPA